MGLSHGGGAGDNGSIRLTPPTPLPGALPYRF